MIAKVINSNLEDYGKEFKVRRLNYEQAVVNYPGNKGIKVFSKSDIEFITEGEVDEFLIKYDDFLKIKLNRGISVALYKVILETVEEQFNNKFECLNLLRDKYIVNKRGIWEKEILCVINNNIPIKIVASGQNFKKSGFNISINEIDKEEFFEICSFEIKKINKEIKEKEEILARYGLAIEKIKNPKNPVKMLL
ncbi:hypothetical protein [Clostridium celatum]|uniref:Uncharacterized protein n=1 Tax=Clostridium celatum DSM 1785 TaxID=545697 RepID=L1QPX4_9CLOT|nr:hypothetical protein [Clostridium celatum]EKY29612.1 hypothetical protein HMPREF0216_00104 [Clostridium celatum DSM 1785]MCE9656591.1 hypothetical protein [Clostridium celatum]MDU2266255.1 hypothetical protein [Clostridium celatum]MDU3723082.1 hypothetical protein [Clostridium celatum]MDU6296139.1 hypothetical protein [Clostridium celatum]